MVRIQNLLVLSVLITAILYAGCGGTRQQLLTYFDQPVDADKNGIIDENDISVLEQSADDCLNLRIRPFLNKAGVELSEEKKPIPPFSESDEDKLKDNLTVTEWEQLMEAVGDYNKLLREIEATEKEIIAGKTSPKPMYDSGTVGDFIVQANGDVTFWLKGGRQAQLIGIKIPDPTTGYLKMCRDYFYKIALNKQARIEYDKLKIDEARKVLLVYLYVGDTFVNAKMVEKGYAYASPMPPNTRYDEQFASLEAKAKSEKRGIWAFVDN